MKIKNCKKKFVGASVFLLGLILSGNVFATDLKLETTEEFEAWKNLSPEEKETSIMPQTFSIEIPKEILEKYETSNVPGLIGSLFRSREFDLRTVSASSYDSKFNLADKLNLRVENQGITNECWAFSTIKSMETNIALKTGERNLKNFSERHMDYSSVSDFIDGTNSNGLNRKAGDGGLPIMGLAYLTNGQGAVLEEDMPFEDNKNEIYLKDLKKDVDTVVTDYKTLPVLKKSYTKDRYGNTTSVTYSDGNGKIYTDSEVDAIRKIIKDHLINEGAIATFNAGSKLEYYNGESIFSSNAYYCNDVATIRDHAVTIVGWDDNYKKENFKEGRRPSKDGAYIVLNSYGDGVFENGYMYVSYEDFFIESELYGISKTSSVDYDNIYQYDNFGGVLQLTSSDTNTGYIGTVFSRENVKNEIINHVGITLGDYVDVEIYLNPRNTSMRKEDLILVSKSNSTLEPGYHRIDITPTKLEGSDFAIVVKQTAKSGNGFSFQVEANVSETPYSTVRSNNKSYFSINGEEWANLSNIQVQGVDMSNTDVCIKGFTIIEDNSSKDSIKSLVYKIDNKYIMNVSHDTTKSEFLKNITTDLGKSLYDENNKEIINDSDIIKTGMKLRLSNNEEYTLIVKGDSNSDGQITILDVSRLSGYYVGIENNYLNENEKKALDLDLDGKVSILDLSLLAEIYNSI